MKRGWFTSALLSCGLASAAAAAGPFDLKGTAPHELDATNPPEDTINKCFACHQGGLDKKGKIYRPSDSWAGTMMANAARDPLYLAALTVAEQDAPGIGTYCLRCHTPQAYVRGDADVALGTALTDDDKQGVACEACHRSSDPSVSLGGAPPVDPAGPYVGNAQLFWDPGVQKHGPYSDADSPAHTTMLDPFTSSSQLCGQCHEVQNPAVHLKDAQGADTGLPFPLDATYTEWSSSAYASGAAAKGCVDCHMPVSQGTFTLSTFPSATPRTDPRRHTFVGGNTWGIDAVMAAEPQLAKDRKLSFKDARASTLELLQSAVTLTLKKAPKAAMPGQTIDVEVRVENNGGHKFPTGYADGRRAFLRLELVDASMKVVSVIGAYDDAKRALVSDAQLHVYEAVQEASSPNGNVAFHIAKNDTITKDTRIPPKGFVAGPTTEVVGADYSDGMGGLVSYDDATFHLAIPADISGGSLVVRATVLYQSTVTELIDELDKANTTDGRGKTLAQIYAATGFAAPVEIARVEATIALPSGGAGGAGGVAASSVAGAGGATNAAGVGGGSSGGGSSGSCGCSTPGSAPERGLITLAVAAGLIAGVSRRASRRRGISCKRARPST